MDKYYIVMSPNGYPLGEGKTKKEAWENSYGPKPWPSHVKRSARYDWIVDAWKRRDDEEEVPGEFRFN